MYLCMFYCSTDEIDRIRELLKNVADTNIQDCDAYVFIIRYKYTLRLPRHISIYDH